MPVLPKLSRLAGLIRDAMAIGAVLSLVLSSTIMLLWAAFSDPLIARLRILLDLDQLARASDVAALASDVRSLSGEDRVIRTRRARSYVEEPVIVGDPVVLVLFVERTEVGASCEFLTGNAVFEDRSGIRSGGPPLRRIQLLPTGAQRLRMTFTAPEDLQPGRVLISLILKFRCGDQPVFNETEPVAFRLRPQPARRRPRSGAGRSGSWRGASTACCATRLARPANLRFRTIARRRWWRLR